MAVWIVRAPASRPSTVGARKRKGEAGGACAEVSILQVRGQLRAGPEARGRVKLALAEVLAPAEVLVLAEVLAEVPAGVYTLFDPNDARQGHHPRAPARGKAQQQQQQVTAAEEAAEGSGRVRRGRASRAACTDLAAVGNDERGHALHHQHAQGHRLQPELGRPKEEHGESHKPVSD